MTKHNLTISDINDFLTWLWPTDKACTIIELQAIFADYLDDAPITLDDEMRYAVAWYMATSNTARHLLQEALNDQANAAESNGSNKSR